MRPAPGNNIELCLAAGIGKPLTLLKEARDKQLNVCGATDTGSQNSWST